MNNTQTHDILAKLLATENLTVIRENVHTASFDIKNRILRLPRWINLSAEVEEMLILHEVGHALFTTPEGYGSLYDSDEQHLLQYANCIEDVRIEKKMKERYPGSRKTFNKGYSELNEKDFFGVKDRNLSELLLIDRINLFYKVGYNAGIEFTAEEYQFVQKTDKCVTEEDVINLAKEIFEYSKQQVEEAKEEEKKKYKLKKSSSAGNPSDVSIEDYEFDELEDESENSESEDELEDDLDLVPKTMGNFDEKLSELQDHESRTFYFDAKFEVESKSPIIGYKQIIEELSVNHTEISIASMKKKAMEFKSVNSNIVNYLVKEFEMRKSASAYKRTKISRLGQLDTRKLFAYQLKEDIFKQISTVQEGKKHGMIFLLDWSGSMSNYISETMEQVINLAMFCNKINIPYQVFAFTDGYTYEVSKDAAMNANGIGRMDCFNLLELFSNKMNNRDFNKMIELMLNKPWYSANRYQLNGTPLNEALMYMIDYIGQFIAKNQTEKMTLITLTDGEGNTLMHHDYSHHGTYGIKNGSTYILENGVSTKIIAKSIIRDTVTRKEYHITDESRQQTSTLMNIIRDRYSIKSVGFYILRPSVSDVMRFYKNNIINDKTTYNASIVMQGKLRKDKCIVLKEIPGRDEMYLLSSTNKIEDEDIDDVTQDMTASQISKQLGKMFTSRKSSRVVLSSFIGMAA